MLELADTDSNAMRTGSLVLVLDDYEAVRDLQDDQHGAWNDAMRNVCFSLTLELLISRIRSRLYIYIRPSK